MISCVEDLMEEPKIVHCGWWLSDEDMNVYSTTCGTEFILNDGTPKANSFKYCPYCGKPIEEAN